MKKITRHVVSIDNEPFPPSLFLSRVSIIHACVHDGENTADYANATVTFYIYIYIYVCVCVLSYSMLRVTGRANR